MSHSVFDASGCRKYLLAKERRAFVRAALRQEQQVASFCLTIAMTGARISEVLALKSTQIDFANGAIVFESLKRRRKLVFRAVPVPRQLLALLSESCERTDGSGRLWPWCRTTAWKRIKRVMFDAEIGEQFGKPKALRHGFAVDACQKGVSLNVVQRWLGHARLETTAIYANALGKEERDLAKRTWHIWNESLGSTDACRDRATADSRSL
jgi:integrase